MDEKENPANLIACHKCRYYQVTWEPRQPYGCRAHGFKTHRSPAQMVYEASGIRCQLFTPKKTPNSD